MTEPVPKRMEVHHVPDVQFVCEQDGDVERELKSRWLKILADRSGLESAYLARVRYGASSELMVALCLRVKDATLGERVINPCAVAFESLFGANQVLDILILSRSQEQTIQAVCRPFFRAAPTQCSGQPQSGQAGGQTTTKKSNPIVWFELQMAPYEFRLAVLPGQPVLFGYEESDGKPGATWLLRAKENPDAIKAFAAGLAEVIRSNPVYQTAAQESTKCFDPEMLTFPSLHLRMAWADGKQWATFYPKPSIPPAFETFLAACRKLGMEKIASLKSRPLTGEEALREVKNPQR